MKKKNSRHSGARDFLPECSWSDGPPGPLPLNVEIVNQLRWVFHSSMVWFGVLDNLRTVSPLYRCYFLTSSLRSNEANRSERMMCLGCVDSFDWGESGERGYEVK